MPGFYDATCPQCHAHVGWCGEASDWPPCDRCGYKPPETRAKELAHAGPKTSVSAKAYSLAREFVQKNLPAQWLTDPASNLVMELARLLDFVAPGGRVDGLSKPV